VVSPLPSDHRPSQVSAFNPLVAFYDIHERKGEVRGAGGIISCMYLQKNIYVYLSVF
jgi:hypothetical protein